jgi:hypothetical protein
MYGYHGAPLGRNRDLVERLHKLIPRLGTTYEAEAIATIRAIDRTLKGAGFDWHDLANAAAAHFSARIRQALQHLEPDSASDWADLARWCSDHENGWLTSRERDFVSGMISWCRWRDPTERQAAWLADIADRLRKEGAGYA